MKTSTTDSSIRAISLLRRLGSVFVILIIFLLLVSDHYHRLKDRLWISDLREIKANGVSQTPEVKEEYEIRRGNNNPQLTFTYSFVESGKMYESKYTLFQFLPKDSQALKKIFTVHYLKEDPHVNTLNIEDEINRIERKIDQSSTFWFIIKILATIIFGFILLGQIFSLISEIKDINKPIEIPDHLKRTS